jgi:hypothetical protein
MPVFFYEKKPSTEKIHKESAKVIILALKSRELPHEITREKGKNSEGKEHCNLYALVKLRISYVTY